MANFGRYAVKGLPLGAADDGSTNSDRWSRWVDVPKNREDFTIFSYMRPPKCSPDARAEIIYNSSEWRGEIQHNYLNVFCTRAILASNHSTSSWSYWDYWVHYLSRYYLILHRDWIRIRDAIMPWVANRLLRLLLEQYMPNRTIDDE